MLLVFKEKIDFPSFSIPSTLKGFVRFFPWPFPTLSRYSGCHHSLGGWSNCWTVGVRIGNHVPWWKRSTVRNGSNQENLANSTRIFGQHSWSGLPGDDFKLPVGRISTTKKTPFVPMWPSTFGFLGFYGWNHGDWPHGNPEKKSVAKAAKNLVKHVPFIDVWWYAQWRRCFRYLRHLWKKLVKFSIDTY